MVNKSALMVYGGWGGHEPEQTTQRFAKILEDAGFSVRLADSLAIFEDQQALCDLDLLVPCWTMGELSKDQMAGLNQAILGGVNVAGWHGGMCDAFRKTPRWLDISGGQFCGHPGGIIDYQVNLVANKGDDPIIAGLEDFAVRTEQYNLLVHPRVEVLATTTFSGEHGAEHLSGCVMPVVWKTTYGAARIFYSALGHIDAEFEVFETREIMRRGLLWAARVDDF